MKKLHAIEQFKKELFKREALIFLTYWFVECVVFIGVLWATASNYDKTEILASVVIIAVLGVLQINKYYVTYVGFSETRLREMLKEYEEDT